MSRLIDRAKSAEKLAEAERERAESEKTRAESEKKRAQSERKRAESAGNRVLLAESKIEDLNQLLSSSKAWPIKNSAVSLIADAVANQHKLPAFTIVPHMRSMADFPQDSQAMTVEATPEELESAERFLRGFTPQVQIQDFVPLEIYDAVATIDREKSGVITFSSDLAWGLELLASENEAKFVSRMVLWHEKGHGAWYEFRGNKQGHSPETFKGANSKMFEGAEVMRFICMISLDP